MIDMVYYYNHDIVVTKARISLDQLILFLTSSVLISASIFSFSLSIALISPVSFFSASSAQVINFSLSLFDMAAFTAALAQSSFTLLVMLETI